MHLSIIIPVYNHAQELKECIDSILVQSLFVDSRESANRTEVIVVNDGSTDGLESGIRNQELRIREAGLDFLFINQPNLGAPAARNNGFRFSHGSLVLFCDADIVFQPNALQTMMITLKNHPEASYAYSSFYFGRTLFRARPFDPAVLRRVNYIHTTSLIRREHVIPFDESLKKFQDWDLWLSMLKQGRIGTAIDEALFTIKPRSEGMSQWLPSFTYKLPWQWSPWIPAVIKKYQDAKEIIVKKHHLF